MKKIILTVFAFLLTAGVVYGQGFGRGMMANGKLETITGTAQLEDNGWFVNSGGKKFFMMTGPLFYSDKIGFRINNGDQLFITGYVNNNFIAPVSIETNGKTYKFRDEKGYPLWGNGKGFFGRMGGTGGCPFGWNSNSD